MSKFKNICAMTIFGTIGVFVKYLSLPSGFIAMARGFSGFAVLVIAVLLFDAKGKKKGKETKPAISAKNLLLLFLSGGLIGVNWILLFESYNYTTVATATLCYYFAPIFVIILSVPLLKERLTLKKALCVLTALLGMAFVSGIAENGLPSLSEFMGVLLALGAAIIYATVVFINMTLKSVSATTKTMLQLLSAAVAVMPYVLVTENISALCFDLRTVSLLITVGVIHTGVAYLLYFDSLSELSAQTAAILGYIDPVVAIILSVIILGEPMTLYNIVGAVLILGSTLVSEIDFNTFLKSKAGKKT